MSSHANNWSTGKIVLVSAAAGLVALLLLLLWLGFAFWSSFLWGLVVGGIVYMILMLNFAGTGDAGAYGGHDSAAAPAGAATGTADVATGDAAGSAGADEAADSDAAEAAGVAPSKDLPGQSELAARKGEWKYDKAADRTEAATATGEDYHKDGIREGTDEGSKPEMLSAARPGGADNLKEIKGVGPKMEQLLNSMGVYHFDQVAGWSADEVAWVDANLKGFKGRVSRDGWVAQAKILAGGGETEFSKRVDKGDVY